MPTDIDQAGRVVGSVCREPFFCEGAVWAPDGSVTVHQVSGYWGTVHRAINNHGQIVGAYLPGRVNDFDIQRAYLWQQGRLYDLTALAAPSGWVILRANDINDRGEIVGWAGLQGVGIRAVLLTPALPTN